MGSVDVSNVTDTSRPILYTVCMRHGTFKSFGRTVLAVAMIAVAGPALSVADGRGTLLLDAPALAAIATADATCASPDHFHAAEGGIIAVEFDDAEWAERLARYYKALSPTERAVLGAALEEGSTHTLVTTACSPSDVLWTHLSWRQYLRPTRDGLPPDMAKAPALRSFQVEAEQRVALTRLLANLNASPTE